MSVVTRVKCTFVSCSGKACSTSTQKSLYRDLTKILTLQITNDVGETFCVDCWYMTHGQCRDVYSGQCRYLGNIAIKVQLASYTSNAQETQLLEKGFTDFAVRVWWSGETTHQGQQYSVIVEKMEKSLDSVFKFLCTTPPSPSVLREFVEYFNKAVHLFLDLKDNNFTFMDAGPHNLASIQSRSSVVFLDWEHSTEGQPTRKRMNEAFSKLVACAASYMSETAEWSIIGTAIYQIARTEWWLRLDDLTIYGASRQWVNDGFVTLASRLTAMIPTAVVPKSAAASNASPANRDVKGTPAISVGHGRLRNPNTAPAIAKGLTRGPHQEHLVAETSSKATPDKPREPPQYTVTSTASSADFIAAIGVEHRKVCGPETVPGVAKGEAQGSDQEHLVAGTSSKETPAIAKVLAHGSIGEHLVVGTSGEGTPDKPSESLQSAAIRIAPPAHVDADVVLRQIKQMYEIYEPAKLDTWDELVEMHADRLEAWLRALRSRHLGSEFQEQDQPKWSSAAAAVHQHRDCNKNKRFRGRRIDGTSGPNAQCPRIDWDTRMVLRKWTHEPCATRTSGDSIAALLTAWHAIVKPIATERCPVNPKTGTHLRSILNSGRFVPDNMKYVARLFCDTLGSDETEWFKLVNMKTIVEMMFAEACKQEHGRWQWRGFWLDAFEKIDLAFGVLQAYLEGSGS